MVATTSRSRLRPAACRAPPGTTSRVRRSAAPDTSAPCSRSVSGSSGAAEFRQHRRVAAGDRLRQAQADPGLRHRRRHCRPSALLRIVLRRLSRGVGDAGAAQVARLAMLCQQRPHRVSETRQRIGDLAGERDVGAEVAHGNALIQRIGPELDHPGSRRAVRGSAGDHGASESIASTTSASASHGLGIAADRHRMIGRDRKLDRPVLHDRDAPVGRRACRAWQNRPREPAPRCAMITGFFAAASIAAACCTSAAGAAVLHRLHAAARGRVRPAGHSSHSTSRGSDRYTGPFGVDVAIA